MSITSISNNSTLTTSLLSGVSTTTNPFAFDTTGSSTSDTSSTNGIGRFAAAIKNAFASLGVSLDGTSSSTSASTSSTSETSATDTSSSDAVTAFMQSLFAALHSQSAGFAPPPPDGPLPVQGTDATAATAATSAASSTASSTSAATASSSTQASAEVGKAHHHHGGKLQADLQSLISELTSSSSTSTDSTTSSTTGTSTDSTTSTDPTLAALENNFNALLAQSGASTTSGTSTSASSDTLAAFLQSLASNLNGAPATGNVVSTTA